MTYGNLRLRLSQLSLKAPELLDGWIQDVYTELLDMLPWKRSEAEIVIQAPVSYADGTVTVTQGLAAITGVGTVWTAGMNGRAIRINNQEEYYQFTDVSGTTATLDRPYEGATGSELTYRIDQPVFVLPATARIVRAVVPNHDRLQPLESVSPAELDRISISRNSYGAPKYYAATWDNFSNPPRMQIDFFPMPKSPNDQGAIPSWTVDLVLDKTDLDPEATGTTLLPWLRPAAIIEGVMAKVRRHEEKLQAAKEHRDEFLRLSGIMARVNAAQRGPKEIRLSEEYRFRRGALRESNPFSKNFDQLVDD